MNMTLLVTFTILGIMIFTFTALLLDDVAIAFATTLLYGGIVMTVIVLKSTINQEDNNSTSIKQDTSQVIVQDTVKDTSVWGSVKFPEW